MGHNKSRNKSRGYSYSGPYQEIRSQRNNLLSHLKEIGKKFQSQKEIIKIQAEINRNKVKPRD